MSAVTFSDALREGTRVIHDETEGATFMHDLMSGKGSREDYVALVVQHYYMYEALEAVTETMTSDAVASKFITSKLTRLPAIVADLDFLIGPDWRFESSPLPATVRYAERIHEISGWAGGFVAHHYTRYLGDLSGGQHIYKVMQRRFGLDTRGVGFYLFEEIPDPAAFKDSYRAQLNAIDWDEQERERVVDEVKLAYRLNTEVFQDLSAAKALA